MPKKNGSTAARVQTVETAVATAVPSSVINNLRNARDCGAAWHGYSEGRMAVAMRMAEVVSGFPNDLSKKSEEDFKMGWYIAKDAATPAPRWARIEGKWRSLKASEGAPDGVEVLHLTAAFVTAYDKKAHREVPNLHKAIMDLRKRYTTDAADNLRDIINLYKNRKAKVVKSKGGRAKPIAETAPKILAALVKSATTAFDTRGDTSLPRDPVLAILNRAFTDIVALTKK